MTTFVRLCCPACADRYGLIVDPDCSICSGLGTIAAKVPDDIDPIIAARAVTRGLDWWVGAGRVETERAKKLRDAGLLVDDNEHAEGLPNVPIDTGDRAQIGRKAGQLLKGHKPKPFVPRPPKPKPPPPTPEELEAMRLAAAEWEALRRDRELEYERQEREERAAERALDIILDAHAEEFAETLDGERVLAAIEDMPEVRRNPWATGS